MMTKETPKTQMNQAEFIASLKASFARAAEETALLHQRELEETGQNINADQNADYQVAAILAPDIIERQIFPYINDLERILGKNPENIKNTDYVAFATIAWERVTTRHVTSFLKGSSSDSSKKIDENINKVLEPVFQAVEDRYGADIKALLEFEEASKTQKPETLEQIKERLAEIREKREESERGFTSFPLKAATVAP